jgi:hypothetical protein
VGYIVVSMYFVGIFKLPKIAPASKIAPDKRQTTPTPERDLEIDLSRSKRDPPRPAPAPPDHVAPEMVKMRLELPKIAPTTQQPTSAPPAVALAGKGLSEATLGTSDLEVDR